MRACSLTSRMLVTTEDGEALSHAYNGTTPLCWLLFASTPMLLYSLDNITRVMQYAAFHTAQGNSGTPANDGPQSGKERQQPISQTWSHTVPTR